jgi:hypothetical protein
VGAGGFDADGGGEVGVSEDVCECPEEDAEGVEVDTVMGVVSMDW